MTAENLVSVAAALADGTRARILVALMDGRAWTARELARHTGVAPSTATGHLNRLVDSGLLVEHRQGRHRYVQLAGTRIAEVVESVAALGNQPTAPVRGLREASVNTQLARARTCYDHLAGALGVTITDALVQQRVLVAESLALTDEGMTWLSEDLGAPFAPGRRPATRACVDWTERRVHLAGAVGAHIAAVFHERLWVRPARSSRAVVVTPAGGQALERLLGIEHARA
ncbi:ArsR/SmtB family transcription factor [Nocardiopsis oceani]